MPPQRSWLGRLLIQGAVQWSAEKPGVSSTSVGSDALRCCEFEILVQKHPLDHDGCDIYRANMYQDGTLVAPVVVKLGPPERVEYEIEALQEMQRHRDSDRYGHFNPAPTSTNLTGLGICGRGLDLPSVTLMHIERLEAATVLVLLPQGIASLHHLHIVDEPFLAANILRWLRQVDRQLAAMHSIQLCHGDVKPSNMVYFCKEGAFHATLIDFEHSVKLDEHTTFCGTIRYTSRRILSILKDSPPSYWSWRLFAHSPLDDFESLFFSAFEILHDEHELPWGSNSGLVPRMAREALLNDDALWASHGTHFQHVTGAWEFMCQARLRLISFRNLSQLWPDEE